MAGACWPLERENDRFLAVRAFFVQELWGSPSRGMALTFWGVSDGVQVLSDRSKAKIRDLCVASVIHEDILLDADQYDRKSRLILIRHSFEIAANRLAGVEKVSAFSDIG